MTQYSSLCATKENPVQALLEYFKKHLTHHIANPKRVLKALSKNPSPETAVELIFGGLVQKKTIDLPLRVIDVYGSLLAARLLIGQDPESQRQDFKLSQQKRFLEGGKQMMPIYTAYVYQSAEDFLVFLIFFLMIRCSIFFSKFFNLKILNFG